MKKNQMLTLSVLLVFVSSTILAQTLSVSTSSLQLNAAQNSTSSFTINSNTYWGIYNLPEWIDVDTVWGNGTRIMNVKVDENSFTIQRKATIVIYCVDANWNYYSDTKIVITQSASSKGISDTTISVGATMGSSVNFSINSDTYWEVTEKPSWVFLNKNSHTSSATITLTATKNPLIINRIGYVTVKRMGSLGNYIYGTVKVIQSPSTLGISQEHVSLSYIDGSFEQVLINNNTGWSISGQASWVTTKPSSSSTNGFTKISVSKNSDIYYRIDTIQVSCTDGTNYSIIITQDPTPASILITPSVLLFAENQTAIQVEVVANTNWGIINLPDWIDSEDIFGWGEKSFELHAFDWVDQREATAILYWFDEREIYHQQNLLIIQSSNPNAGIQDFNSGFIVFPNPVVDFFTIHTTNNIECNSVQLLTVDGKLLDSWQSKTNSIDVSIYPDGNYVLQCIDSKNQIYTTGILKKSR